MILLLGCAKRIVTLAVIVALAFAAWHYRANLVAAWDSRSNPSEAWSRLLGAPAAASTTSPEEAARTARVKLDALTGPHPPARTALSSAELQALVHRLITPDMPRWVDSTRVELEGNQFRVSGRVPADRIPQVKELGEVAGLLPDTPEVAVKGQLLPLPGGGAALAVDQVTAAHIPVPHRLIPAVVRSLKRPGDTSPPDQLRLPLPRSVSSAYVRNDSLILLSAGAAAPRQR